MIVGWSRADLGEPTTLLLVRHGATQHSFEHRFSGCRWSGPRAGRPGRRQAGAVGRGAGPPRGRRCRGDLAAAARQADRADHQRAAGAARTASVVDGPGRGRLRGVGRADLRGGPRERWPGRLAAWLAAPDIAAAGRGVLRGGAAAGGAARAELLARFPRQRVVAVSHTTPIKVLVQGVLGAPAASAYRFELAPGSLTTLACVERRGRPRSSGLGEVGHLHGVMHDTA